MLNRRKSDTAGISNDTINKSVKIQSINFGWAFPFGIHSIRALHIEKD